MPKFALMWPGRRPTSESTRPKLFIFTEFREFLTCLVSYLHSRLRHLFVGFELVKGVMVDRMYRQRGKYAGVFIHLGVVSLGFFGLTLGPSLVAGVDSDQAKLHSAFQLGNGVGGSDLGSVLGESNSASPVTIESDKPRAEVESYVVAQGDTLSTIANKFGVSIDSIRWLNPKVTSINSIKPGDNLKIPPVTGIVHSVKSGETIYSIAKKYSADAQSIVDFPFNTFTNDETFALAIGQQVVIPDGAMPAEQPWSPTSGSLARKLTPDAGAVSATGTWIWPAAGVITQPWRPWHHAIDIANSGGGNVLAADSGKVIVAGWPDNWGYGNRIVIDHGNGYQTLYAHLSRFSVVVNQTVKRGDIIGQMGSTGRSTGTHLHFEIRTGGRGLNPLEFLK